MACWIAVRNVSEYASAPGGSPTTPPPAPGVSVPLAQAPPVSRMTDARVFANTRVPILPSRRGVDSPLQTTLKTATNTELTVILQASDPAEVNRSRSTGGA